VSDQLISELVHNYAYWIKGFPAVCGISTVMNPLTIFTGIAIDYNKHCHIEFGSYVTTHEEHDNSMDTGNTGAMAMRLSGNEQEGHFFTVLTQG
jgi:hypothetical protein